MTELSKLEQEIREAQEFVAKNHSFTDWQHLLKAHSGRLDFFITEVTKEVCRKKIEQAWTAAVNHTASEYYGPIPNKYPNKDQWIKEHL